MAQIQVVVGLQLLLLQFSFISAEFNISSDLEGRATYACSNERVVFTCSGPDAVMVLYVPPFLNRTDPEVFTTGSDVGTGSIINEAISTQLVSTSPGIVSQLTISLSGFGEETLTVFCENGPNILNLRRMNSTYNRQPMINDEVSGVTNGRANSIDGDYDFGAMSITWDPPRGEYDVECYEVDVMGETVNISSTFLEATYSGQTAYALITVITRCGQRTRSFQTNSVQRQLSASVTIVTALMVIFLVLFLVFLATTLVFIYLWKQAKR